MTTMATHLETMSPKASMWQALGMQVATASLAPCNCQEVAVQIILQ